MSHRYFNTELIMSTRFFSQQQAASSLEKYEINITNVIFKTDAYNEKFQNSGNLSFNFIPNTNKDTDQIQMSMQLNQNTNQTSAISAVVRTYTDKQNMKVQLNTGNITLQTSDDSYMYFITSYIRKIYAKNSQDDPSNSTYLVDTKTVNVQENVYSINEEYEFSGEILQGRPIIVVEYFIVTSCFMNTVECLISTNGIGINNTSPASYNLRANIYKDGSSKPWGNFNRPYIQFTKEDGDSHSELWGITYEDSLINRGNLVIPDFKMISFQVVYRADNNQPFSSTYCILYSVDSNDGYTKLEDWHISTTVLAGSDTWVESNVSIPQTCCKLLLDIELIP